MRDSIHFQSLQRPGVFIITDYRYDYNDAGMWRNFLADVSLNRKHDRVARGSRGAQVAEFPCIKILYWLDDSIHPFVDYLENADSGLSKWGRSRDTSNVHIMNSSTKLRSPISFELLPQLNCDFRCSWSLVTLIYIYTFEDRHGGRYDWQFQSWQ